MYTSYYYYCY